VEQQHETWWFRHEKLERERLLAELGQVLPELKAAEHDQQARRRVARTTARLVLRELASAWDRGWQPGDVLHLARRQLTAVHLELLRAAIAVELAGYPPSTVHPRWHAQLEEFEIRLVPSSEAEWLLSCGRHRDVVLTLGAAIDVAAFLTCLYPLKRLTPLPGKASASGATKAADVDPKVLARVKALLAKAESTTYEAEADTFTAGAQALMARHSIDGALLAAAADEPQVATGLRIWIEAPYESAKVSLLVAVAEANRCRTVSQKPLGFCTVVGFEADLVAVDALFTSLLVQATHAMTLAGPRVDPTGRSRTRAFRYSFLVAFAQRIGERLTEAARGEQQQAAGAAGGERLLPVLAAREAEVERHLSELFPSLRRGARISAGTGEGWASGRAAADRAALGIRGRLPA
jgi:Protein of unknown function (DUF2786)